MPRGGIPKPPAAHGTYARYIARCRCAPCSEASRKYSARRYALHGTGRPLTVNAEKAAERLRALRAAGATWDSLTTTSGCPKAVLHAILTGRQRIHRTTERRILAVRPADAVSELAVVPALGATRRLRALVAIGHKVTTIEALAGLNGTTMANLLSGAATQIRLGTHAAVAGAFTELAMTRGASIRSVRRAQAAGWAPPLAWDDIDDPDEQPQLGERAGRGEAVIEDVTELARLGVCREDIAERLDTTWANVVKVFSRAGISVPEVTA